MVAQLNLYMFSLQFLNHTIIGTLMVFNVYKMLNKLLFKNIFIVIQKHFSTTYIIDYMLDGSSSIYYKILLKPSHIIHIYTWIGRS